MVTNQLDYPRQPLIQWGAVSFSRVTRGEYYRLLTSMFLHVDPTHIFFNGLALWIWGQVVESLFGHIRFALIYFLGGLSGSIAVVVFSRESAVGASGALFALLAAEIVFLYRNQGILGQRARQQLRSSLTIAALNIGLSLWSNFDARLTPISLWGHVGGFVAGLILAWFMSPLYQLQPDPAAPLGARVVDARPISKTWPMPAIFSVALVVILS